MGRHFHEVPQSTSRQGFRDLSIVLNKPIAPCIKDLFRWNKEEFGHQKLLKEVQATVCYNCHSLYKIDILQKWYWLVLPIQVGQPVPLLHNIGNGRLVLLMRKLGRPVA
jgi:hypothetical protein